MPFYTRIRRGRPPEPEQLAELESRYRAIGGVSPLAERTQAQVDAVRAELETRSPGRYVVAFGAKHTDPLIEDAAADAWPRPAWRRSSASSSPRTRPPWARRSTSTAPPARSPGRPSSAVGPWYAEPAFVALLAARVTAALGHACQGRRRVIFTAHSLPERIRQSGDTYPEQLAESARLVAEAAGLDEWLVAWQSAGRTPEPWLGPDVRDEVRRLAGEGATDAVVVCPIGFVADHLEVLYDLDVELAAVAAAVRHRLHAHGVAQRRPRVRRRAGRRDRRGRRGAPDVAPGRVVVVGGGISGLTAAWELTGGADAPRRRARGRGARVVDPPRRRAAQRRVRRARRRHGSRRLPRSPARGGRPVPRARARRRAGPDRGTRRVGLGPGPPARRCPRGSRSASRPGSGPRPAPASSGSGASSASPATPSCPGPTSGARSATAPSDRSSRASWGSGSSTRWSTPSSAASTPARSTTCPPPRSSRRSWPRRSAGAASCAPSGPRCPRRTPTAPRCSGRSTAAWPRWCEPS